MISKRNVAKLDRVCRLVEALPGYHGCTTTIRKAWRITQQTIKDLSERAYNSVTSKKVVKIIKFLAELFALLERLKNLFNFCLQPFLYGYKYSFYN